MEKKKKKTGISIIIPVYNAEKTISEVARRVLNTLNGKREFELLLVNDGSIDNSIAECLKLSRKYPFVKVIDLSKNFGQHNAIMAGLNFAKGEYIIFMDDDLQTPPEACWELIEKIDKGYDAVYARYVYKMHSRFRNIGSGFRGFMANMIFDKPKHVVLSSYFIIRRFLVPDIIKYSGPYTNLGGLVLRSTNNIENVNILHNKRMNKTSNYTLRKLTAHWLNGFINFSSKPLRISFFIGLTCFIIALGFAIFLLINKISNPELVMGWTSIILAILFFSGIQLMIIGILGEYIGRIFLIQNKHPQYIIRNKYNI